MVTVRQVMADKGQQVLSTTPETTVFEAIAAMAAHGVGALVVLDTHRLAGIVSERDYTRKIALADRSSRTTRVAEIMTARVITVRPEQTIDECMLLMERHAIRHLPVVEGARVTGVLAVQDLLRGMIAEKDLLITQLENYIAGAA